MQITIETQVKAPVETVWAAWTTPADIRQWNAANNDWHTPDARIDLRVGGSFSYRMEAKDGSMGFDFCGEFTAVSEYQTIEFVMDDDRSVRVDFLESDDGVTVRETFEAESENEAELQRQGWQAILHNFARHLESRARLA